MGLALSPATVGAVFGLGGGLGVLLGSATAALASRTFGLGRTLVSAHLLFGVLGVPLALSARAVPACRARQDCPLPFSCMKVSSLDGLCVK